MKMLKIYARLIKKKLMTIEDVPLDIRDEVQKLLQNLRRKWIMKLNTATIYALGLALNKPEFLNATGKTGYTIYKNLKKCN